MQTYIFQPDLNSTDFCMCKSKKINGGFPWAAKCKGIYTIFLLCFVFFKFLIINKHYFYNKNKNRTTSCPVLALQFTSLLELLGGRDHFSSLCLREIGREGGPHRWNQQEATPQVPPFMLVMRPSRARPWRAASDFLDYPRTQTPLCLRSLFRRLENESAAE